MKVEIQKEAHMREQAIEKIGDLIYNTLQSDHVTKYAENKAYITDILSQALYDAGYRIPAEPEKEEKNEL